MGDIALLQQKNEKLWTEDILPNWDKLWLQSKKCRTNSIWNTFQTSLLDGYLLDGVPVIVRGEVWTRLIPTSEENISSERFMALDDITYSRYGIRVGLSRRALQESSLSSHTVVGSEANVGQHPAPVAQDSTPLLEDTSIPVCNAGGTGEENGLVVLNQARAEILKDLPRTYPTLGFYHDGGTMAQSLEGVLLIYVAEHPEQGYMQGMSFLAASLLLYLDPYPAYNALLYIMRNSVVGRFLTMDMPTITAYVNMFQLFFQKMLPKLYAHFEKEVVSCQSLLMDWLMSLFVKALPLTAAMRVWDLYFYWGEIQIVRTAIGILTFLQDRLLRHRHDTMLTIIRELESCEKEQDLLKTIQQVKLSQSEYDRVWNKCCPRP